MNRRRAYEPGRRERRLLLALLTGATNLSGAALTRAAQVGISSTYIGLTRLQENGWIISEWADGADDAPYRPGVYRLTPWGRVRAARLLGLDLP